MTEPTDSVQPKPNESVQPDENAKVEEVHKKRKEMKVRSKVWDHFLKIFDENGNLVNARCVHCKNVWAAEPRKHGTNNLKTHMGTCSLNPGLVIASGQTQFQFQLKGESVVGQPTTWKFDHAKSRQSLARMIVKDEQPFSMVENEGFQDFVRTSLPPTFGIPSRRTVTRDCLELYNETKSNMKSMFKETKQRFSITTDTWTSNQRMSYMCITAHWINEQWEIKKTVLSFSPVDSHKGVDIGEAIEKCLLEWGVDKLFCVTVDNASANDNVIKSLKSVLRNWGTSILDGEHLHMRCVAHILNLVVQDGLREISDSHNAVRAAVKYVKQSPARLKKFKECAEREKIESNKTLCGDVPTRWNSTYMMLDVAEKYEKAFERYERQDPQFAKDLNS